MQLYVVVVFVVLTRRNVAATKTTIPTDKNNLFIIVLLQLAISANLLCFAKTSLYNLIVYDPSEPCFPPIPSCVSSLLMHSHYHQK
jgi:hypothetical protein